jgi:hypothetical protein
MEAEMTYKGTENWLQQDKSDSGYHTWSKTWTAEEAMAAETKDNKHKEVTTVEGGMWFRLN